MPMTSQAAFEPAQPDVCPLAYLITFTCYGTRLHGDAKGTVDRHHNLPGTPLVAPSPKRTELAASQMRAEAYLLDEPRRRCVLDVIVETCAARQWRLHAAHIPETHIHLVVAADRSPETVMNTVKAHATRRLKSAGGESGDRRRWTRHGSTKYLWDEKAVAWAVHYVLKEQGEPMAAYDGCGKT